MSAASGIGYNPDNMWSDLKTLQRAREGSNKYLLCLAGGKLATSLVERDTRKAKKSWGSWLGNGVSSVTRTVGGLVYDNNREHIAQYLERLTKNFEERSDELLGSLDERQVDILKGVPRSLRSFADEYSAISERKCREKIVKDLQENPELVRDRKEGSYGAVSHMFRDVEERISRVLRENATFKSRISPTSARTLMPRLPFAEELFQKVPRVE